MKIKISKSCIENYDAVEELIDQYNLSGKEVLRLLTDWNGVQILDKEFMENLRDCEGYDALQDGVLW